MSAGIFDCLHLTLKASFSEARSNEYSSHFSKLFLDISGIQMLAVDVVDIDLALIRGPGVHEGLQNGLVCILKLHILAYESYVNAGFRMRKPV